MYILLNILNRIYVFDKLCEPYIKNAPKKYQTFWGQSILECFILFLKHIISGVLLNGNGAKKCQKKGKGIKPFFTWKYGSIPKPDRK